MSEQVIEKREIPQWSLQVALGGGLLTCLFIVLYFETLGLMAIVGLAGFLISMFTHPLVVFLLYFGALFFKDATLPGMSFSMGQVLAPLFFLSTAVYYVRGRALTPRFALFPVITLVISYFIITGLVGEDLENGLIYGRYAVIYLLLAVALAMGLNSERKIYALSWIILVTTAIAAGHGMWEALDKNLLAVVGNFWGKKRVMGTAPNSVVFGWNMIYAFPFAFFLFAQLRSGYTRLLALGLGLFIMAVATFTFNRQTYVIMAIVMALCALLFEYKNRALFVMLVGVMAVVGVFTVLPQVLRRLLTVTNLTKDYSFLERQDSYLMGMEMFKAHPVMGVGFGAYSKVWTDYIPADYSTYFAQYRGTYHPKFMDMGIFSIIVETGLIGIALFAAWIFVLFSFVWRRRRAAIMAQDRFVRNFSSAVLVGLIFFLISSFIQDTFLYTRVWVLYGLAFLLDPRHLPLAAEEELERDLPGGAVADGG